MGLFSNRRTRKSSPSPSGYNGGGIGGNGNASMRSRNGNSSRGLNSLQETLPLVSPASSSSPKRIKNGGSNLLLFGGQYYPGKDKKRRQLVRRKRWLGQQRRGNKSQKRGIIRATSIVALLFGVRYLIGPIWNRFVDFKVNRRVDRYWTTERMSLDGDAGSSMKKLSSMQNERKRVAKLQIELETQDAEGGAQERLELLKRLVPKFANRNNINLEQQKETGVADINALEKEKKTSSTTTTTTTTKRDETKNAPKKPSMKKQTKQQNEVVAPKSQSNKQRSPIEGDQVVNNGATVDVNKSMATKGSKRDAQEQLDIGESHKKGMARHGSVTVKTSPKRRRSELPVEKDTPASPVDPRSNKVSKMKGSQPRSMKSKNTSKSADGNGQVEKKPSFEVVPMTEKDAMVDVGQDVSVKPKRRTLSTMADFVGETSCPANLKESDRQTTLVTQTTLDRLWILEETCLRWHMPIVAVVPLTPEQRRDERTVFALGNWDECPQLKLIQHSLASNESKPGDYPVNLLRNIGLNAVETSHILLADIDFVPSQDLDKTIQDTLELKEQLRSHLDLPSASRDAMVVPAFERILPEPCATPDECKQHLRKDHNFIPHTFDDLRNCVSDKDCIVFQSKVNWEGHFTTDSEAWLAKQWFEGPAVTLGEDAKFRDVRRIDCFDTLRYEPYMVLEWCPTSSEQRPLEAVAPYYDERFHGYGKNKISYIQHLRLSGYQFSVLPKGFLVHNPHVESSAKEVWSKRGSELHHAMDQLYPKFLQELTDKYRPQKGQIVEICKRHRS